MYAVSLIVDPLALWFAEVAFSVAGAAAGTDVADAFTGAAVDRR